MLKPAITVALIVMLFSGCSTFVPRDIKLSRLAYIYLDSKGEPSTFCFDTISPNNCISGTQDSLLKRLNPKHHILLQKYILVVGEPTQIDCKSDQPNECRLYFEHTYVDIVIESTELNQLKKQLQEITI